MSSLILSHKTIMSVSHWDKVLRLVYIIIGNLDKKTRQFQKWPETLFLGSISIIHEQSEDANNKNKDLNVKIYYMVLKTMLQHTYFSFYSRKMKY